MASFADISIRFGSNLKEFSTQMENAQREMKKFGREMTKTGKALSIGLTAPIAALGAQSFKVFMDFEDQMAKVKAISGATAVEFDKLKQNALELGAATLFSSSQVAELQLNLSKLGFSSSEILDATAGIIDLSIATGEDLAQSATVAASTIRGFGLEAKDATRVADVMAASFSASALDLNKFQTAMAVLAPVAQSAGVSLEQATGMLSVLVNAGIDASTAGTGLRNVFLDIASKGLTLEEALGKINKAQDANVVAMDLFGKRGATVATVLAQNYDAAKDFEQQYVKSAGAAKAMARIMEDSAKGSMTELSSAWESLNIAIGETMSPMIREIADRLSVLIRKFKDLSPETKRWTVAIGALAAVIGPVMVTIGFLATNVIPGLIAALTKLKLAMMTNPWLALGIAIAAVATALTVYVKTSNEATAVTRTLSEVRSRAAQMLAEERSNLDSLLKIAKDETRAKSEREEAIRKINNLSPEYLENIKLETINTEEAAASIDRYIESLNRRAQARAAEEMKTELFLKKLEKEVEILGDNSWVQRASNKFWEFFGVETNQIKGVEDFNNRIKESLELGKMSADQAESMRRMYAPYIEAREKEIATIQAQIDVLDAYIVVSDEEKKVVEDLKSGYTELGRAKAEAVALDLEAITQSAFAKKIEMWEKEIEILKHAQSQYPATAKEYKLLGEQIASISRNIEMAINGPETSLARAARTMSDYALKMKIFAKVLNESISSLVNDAAVNIAVGFGEVLAGMASGMSSAGDIANSMLNTLADLMIQVGKSAIQLAITLEAISVALKNMSPAVALVAGVALVALGTLIKGQIKAKAFADGGIVYGPTLGLVGEYSGVRNDPEVIAPLSKLKGLISDGARGIPYIVGAKIEGNDLRLVLNRANERHSRFGGN